MDILASQILDLPTSYPSDGMFIYPVNYFPGSTAFNSVFGEDAEAARQQSLEEHNDALTKYIQPGMTPVQLYWAIQKGKEEESALPQFWSDNQPRRATRPTSNMMSGVRINPDNTISIQFGGKGKWYTYRGGPNRYEASLEAQKLVSAPDIEKELNRNGGWSLTHKL
jgi:hypothetical protein